MNIQTINELKKLAKCNEFFWNGLFAVLYEPIRGEHNLTNITIDSGRDDDTKNYYIPVSETTIKNVLSCKRKLDYEDFLFYCKGINYDIENQRFTNLVPYINKTFVYLEKLDDRKQKGKKKSISKKYRQKFLAEAERINDDNYILEQELAQNELEEKKILDIFSDLSKKEMSLLYKVADGIPYSNEYDDLFIEYYPQLNKKGKSLFLEALEIEKAEFDTSNSDEFCDFCRKMSEEMEIVQQEIIPEMLYKKLLDINYCFMEGAELLKKYRYINKENWKVLEQYHRLILAYSDEKIEGFSFSSKDCLVIFFDWLIRIPSLNKR